VQASLKLVLEPIFEADFKPCSYGVRPGRRPHDAIAEIQMLASNAYHWVLEGDIEACFDHIDHRTLIARLRDRIGDRRVVALIKAFLRSGVLSEDGITRDTKTGAPQGGILSPLLANIAPLGPRRALRRGLGDDHGHPSRAGPSPSPGTRHVPPRALRR
jgi:RNA-directed DNA polymerase